MIRIWICGGILMVAGLVSGCEEKPAAEPPMDGSVPANAEAASPPPSTAQAAPAASAATAAIAPEDQVIDAEAEAPIRAKAAELYAIRPLDLTRRKVGEEVVVLVRGKINDGGVYGSGPYTLDSSIRRTAIHAGALKNGELGLVRVKIFQHSGEHTSEERNGVRPNKWGKYHASYSIKKIDLPASAAG